MQTKQSTFSQTK